MKSKQPNQWVNTGVLVRVADVRSSDLSGPDRKIGLVAFAGLFRKIFLEFSLHAVKLLGVGHGGGLAGDIGPDRGKFGVDLKPFFKPGFGIGTDGLGWAFGLANTAIYAFVGMNDEHVFALIKAVDRADFDAVCIFALDAIVRDDIGHETSPIWKKTIRRVPPEFESVRCLTFFCDKLNPVRLFVQPN